MAEFLVSITVLLALVTSSSTLPAAAEAQFSASAGLNQDAEALRGIRQQITGDPTQALSDWDTGRSPCRWSGVECDGEEPEARVVGLELWGLELEGSLSREIGKLTELRRLVVVGNRLTGGVPSEIGSCHKLITIDLRANQFTGSLSFNLARFQSLEVLKLSENQLSGTLDALFVDGSGGDCPRLMILDLAENEFEGKIPEEISRCIQLEELSLSGNRLDGGIPSAMASLLHMRTLLLNSNFLDGNLPASIAACQRLEHMDVSDNMLTGAIPLEFAGLAGSRRFNFSINDFHGPIPLGKWDLQQMLLSGTFSNNPGLCGWPLTNPCQVPTQMSVSRRSMAEAEPKSRTSVKKKVRKWALGLALGLVAGALSAALLATVLRVSLYYMQQPPYIQGPIIFHPKIEPRMLAFLERDDQFNDEQMLGRGGAGIVYKAKLETPGEGMEVAVKAVKEDQKALFGKQQIQAELETLGCIRHRNLVALLAYVHRPACHLLLYQYMHNGSLYDAFRKIQAGELVMPWPIRHRVAVGIADGLSYLHFECMPTILHRDLKPANILLDENFVAHLADFGLAKVVPGGDTHISTGVAGTVGYIAPEYSQTCRFTDKSDVYSLGVVLAGLITGKDPTDHFFTTVHGGNIGSWLHHLLLTENGKEAIDPQLRSSEFDDEILLAMKIAVFCTGAVPADRPSSKDVLVMLNQIREAEPDPASLEAPAE